MISRRNFIKNTAGILIAAPMVVRAESIMKVRSIPIIDPDLSGVALAALNSRLDISSLSHRQAQTIYNSYLRNLVDTGSLFPDNYVDPFPHLLESKL